MNRCVGKDCNAPARNERSHLCQDCFDKALTKSIEEDK